LGKSEELVQLNLDLSVTLQQVISLNQVTILNSLIVV